MEEDHNDLAAPDGVVFGHVADAVLEQLLLSEGHQATEGGSSSGPSRMPHRRGTEVIKK